MDIVKRFDQPAGLELHINDDDDDADDDDDDPQK